MDAGDLKKASASRRLSTLVHRLKLSKQLLEPSPSSCGKKRAAVLICLFEGGEGDVRVFLIERASNVGSFAGQIALPGGRREEEDRDDVETALREAKEEIGLDPSLVQVVTALEPFEGQTNVVVPVIGVLHEKNAFCPVINPEEVALILDMPLEMFLKDENRTAREDKTSMGQNYNLHHFYHEAENKSYEIWGFTAAILIKAASVVYQRPTAFMDKPPKLWYV